VRSDRTGATSRPYWPLRLNPFGRPQPTAAAIGPAKGDQKSGSSLKVFLAIVAIISVIIMIGQSRKITATGDGTAVAWAAARPGRLCSSAEGLNDGSDETIFQSLRSRPEIITG